MASSVTFPPRSESRDRWLMALLITFLVTRMFMVFRSGLPQPSDLGMVLVIVAFLRQRDLSWMFQNFRPYVLFVGWVVVVNTSWALLRLETDYFIHMAYYVYNLCIVTLIATTRYRNRERFDRLIEGAIIVSAALQVTFGIVDGVFFRADSTFNNPNQLGFWAIGLGATYLVVRRPNQLGRDLFVLASLAFVEVITTSRAGVVGFAGLLLVWLYEVSARSRYRYMVIVGLALLVVIAPTLTAVAAYLDNLEVVGFIESRFSKDSTAEEVAFRNTDRIFAYYQYTIIGAGEGDLGRFPYTIPIEIHSTPGTLIFSYGIPGCILFAGFVAKLVRGLRPAQIAAISCLFIYSITHQGMRFAFFWFCIAVMASESVWQWNANRVVRAATRRAPATAEPTP